MSATPESDFYKTFWPRFEDKTEGVEWLPIRYWTYWDFARSFSVQCEDSVFVFETPFLEKEDEWADYFEIAQFSSTIQGEPAELQSALPDDQVRRYTIPVSQITLDRTRKSFIHMSFLRLLRTEPSGGSRGETTGFG